MDGLFLKNLGCSFLPALEKILSDKPKLASGYPLTLIRDIMIRTLFLSQGANIHHVYGNVKTNTSTPAFTPVCQNDYNFMLQPRFWNTYLLAIKFLRSMCDLFTRNRNHLRLPGPTFLYTCMFVLKYSSPRRDTRWPLFFFSHHHDAMTGCHVVKASLW